MSFQDDSRSPYSTSDPREEEFRERLQFQIYSWIQKEIPSWQPERSPKYLRNSQALAAGLPGKEKSAAGLIYFKNVFDPCWSDEDLARLHKAEYPWMLMILSPCERFYELESRFNDIAARLHRCLLWQPDAPSKTEFENLRSLMFDLSAGDAGTESPIYKAIQGAHPILAQLYVHRGQLIAGSERCAIGREIRDGSISYFLSARLSAVTPRGSASAVSKERAPARITTEDQSLHWAELLTGRPEIRDGSTEQARAQLIEWMDSIENFFKKLPEFPEAFATIRISRELNSIRAVVQILKPILYSLQTSAFTLREAMDHIARNFAFDEERLLKWRDSLENLGGLSRWMPALIYAQDYLRAAFPLGQGKIDLARNSLLRALDEPFQFMEAKERNSFDLSFQDFKKNYVDCYYSLHENSFQINDENYENSKIDPVALRNLDLLTGLQHTDKIYLNRVNILAKWVQRNKCNLPLHKILERYPRCYCNYNPLGSQQPAGMGAKINAVIQEGIEYFRTILRNCEDIIMEEITLQEVDESISRQITILLSREPMAALKPQSIEVLNKIIWKYSAEFLSSIRGYTPPKSS
jgi:hypothetical protein